MNGKTNSPKKQTGNRGGRLGGRGGKQKKAIVPVLSAEQEAALKQTTEEISKGLQSFTWRDLETAGKFSHNDKLTFIRDDMLIVGCDIGSETHYARAIDAKGRELSKGAYSFENNTEGFQRAKDWALHLAAQHGKNQIVLGLEPTGHYWFSLAAWMIANGISVVQVNPYAVKQTKELADNSQDKNDVKYPKLIADLVKNGNYGVPYLPEDVYAELRVLCTLRDQLMEDRVRNMNRLHREMKIVFPEYREAFGKIDGIFTLRVLASAPLPSELAALGEDGVKDIWHAEKLRGGGYKRAREIVRLASVSAGLRQGAEARKIAIVSFVDKVIELAAELEEIEAKIARKCREIPGAENILEGRLKQVHVKDVRGIVESGAYIIDVREAWEYELSHIKGAHNIPLTELRDRLDEIPRDIPVYLHCRTSQRSYYAYCALKARGFDNVVNLSGSFLGICLHEYFNDKTTGREPIVTDYNFK